MGDQAKPCIGDFNADKVVDAKDLLNLLCRFAAANSHTYSGKYSGKQVKHKKLSGTQVGNVGTFKDWRSGNQNVSNTKTLGNLPGSSASRTVQFKYKYVVGYCGKKGEGSAPTFTLTVGGTKRWSRILNLKTEDYPYDRGCGGDRNKYSPTQTATFTVPKNTKAQSIILALTIKSRNLHVVGQGVFVFGKRTMCTGDLTGDSSLDVMDLLEILKLFGTTTPKNKSCGKC